MIRPLFTWILLVTVTTVYSKLKCTKCPFHIEPTGHTKCTDTCEGDICYIVVNAFYNGTKIAGCLNLHEGDNFEGPAICYRQAHQTSCACTTKDFCNAPTAPIANFKFTETPILEGYQLQPLVGGGGSGSGSGADSKATLATLKPEDPIGTPGVKPGEGTSEPKTEAPAPHSKSTTFPFTLAVAIFAVSLIVLVIF